ncbi:cell division protein FtsL [Deltaproteobacteria bacterium]|nr:cell division protein FtsL [Deltaproteobacteria bacterium]
MVRPSKPSEVEGRRNIRTGININNSRIKRNRFYFTNRQIILITFMLILFMGSGIGYVWSNYEGTQICFDLSRLQQDELNLKELNQKLKVELATLKSPQNLEAAARTLGLREALPEQIIILP